MFSGTLGSIVFILYALKIPENQGFLLFSGFKNGSIAQKRVTDIRRSSTKTLPPEICLVSFKRETNHISGNKYFLENVLIVNVHFKFVKLMLRAAPQL